MDTSKFLFHRALAIIHQLTLLFVQWGFVGLVLGTAGHFWSPLFRGLTPQFKVYGFAFEHTLFYFSLDESINSLCSFLQISMMTLGGIIEADRRLIAHEKMMRHHHRRKRNSETWRLYEEDFDTGKKEISQGHVNKEEKK